MNCLLLLIILFCCNGNGGCNNTGYSRGRDNARGCNTVGCNTRRDNAGECGVNRRESDCDAAPCVHTHTPPPMPRTQFPYLDVEPRTCGCEEKADS